jgi:hypothetical protein
MTDESQKKLAVLAMLFLSAAIVMIPGVSSPKKETPAVQETAQESAPEIETGDDDYEVGYKTGYNSLLIQMDRTPEFKEERYTAGGEWSRHSEEVSRGYVDGYHRAADEVMRSSVCPGHP